MKAEYARVVNAPIEDIMSNYDRAIEASPENRFVQYKALAYELASKFYQSIGIKLIARMFLVEAHHCYQQWGALAKVHNLESQYPQYLGDNIRQEMEVTEIPTPPDSPMTSPSLQQTSSVQLDLESVMKASQLLSREIVLSNLLQMMMRIVIENAGATRGLLILEKDGQWLIEGEGILDIDEVTVQQSISIEESEHVPATLINYVSRTHEKVVLADAKGEGGFTKDAYIIKHQSKSILGLPILNNNILIGILYLENNLTNGAFTTDRLQVINLLAFQAGISLENARLFEETQKKSEELSEEIAVRKQAEVELKESEERFRKISENAPVLIDSFDEDGSCLFWNKQCEKTFGWTIDEINEQEVALELFYPDPAVCEEVIRTVTTDPDGSFREWHPITKEGKILSIMWANFSLPNGQVFSMGHDITERKLAEQALKESEKNLIIGQQIAHMGYWKLNVTTMEVQGSEELSKIFKLSHDEMNLEGFAKVVHPDDREFDLAHIKRGIEKGIPWDIEHRIIANDEVKWVRAIGKPDLDKKGKVINIVGIVQDITEQKQAEQALKESEANLNNTFNLSPSIISKANIETGYFIEANQAVTRILGYSIEEFTSTPLVEMIHPDDIQRTTNEIEVQLNGKDITFFENRYLCKDGSYKWMAWHGTKADKDGVVTAIGSDITERKLAQLKLSQSTQLLEASQSIAKLGGWELDLVTNTLFWTAETYKIHDTSPDEFNPTVDAGVGYFFT